MSKLLRTILWRPAHNGRHKKLSEEILNYNEENKWKSGKKNALEEDFSCDGYEEDEIVSFQVKYLGSTVVEKLSDGENIGQHAVQLILTNLKSQKPQKSRKNQVVKTTKKEVSQNANEANKRKKNSRNVTLTISPKGLCVMQADQGVDVLKISIYRISNCRTHQQRIVSFLATDALETTECHAFLCKGRKSAENVALAMAKAFHVAYEQWSNVAPLFLGDNRTTNQPVAPTRIAPLIIEDSDVKSEIAELLITFDDDKIHVPRDNLTDDNTPNNFFTGNSWVSFEENQAVDLLY